jgi:hypothetical protein
MGASASQNPIGLHGLLQDNFTIVADVNVIFIFYFLGGPKLSPSALQSHMGPIDIILRHPVRISLYSALHNAAPNIILTLSGNNFIPLIEIFL